MKLSEFLLLSEEEKKKIVLHDAILISKRKNEEEIIFLFQLNNFYIEAQCDYVNKSVIEYRVSNATRFIEPYLDSIHIGDIGH